MTTTVLYTPSWSSFGGGEKYLCVLASAIARRGRGRVILLLDREDISREDLRTYFSVSLENVETVVLPRKEIRQALRSASAAFLLSNVHAFGLPAPDTFYVLQIPYTALSPIRNLARANPREAFKDFRRKRLLDDARRARGVLVYSEFVRDVLRRHHGIESTVLYPPIDDFATGVPKEHLILSVGRFFRGLYNDKRYDVLLEAFRTLHAALPAEDRWEYHISGSCGPDNDARTYLELLRANAEGLPVFFHVNAPYEELHALYGRASVFWHAAGFGVDEANTPERTEHFGMSTVEAMSASCVPVVVNRGGQKEIVTDGVNGFLWESTHQLVERTRELARDSALLQRMGVHARTRYADFAVDRFFQTVNRYLTQHGL